jgi:serine/threonine protein kinase
VLEPGREELDVALPVLGATPTTDVRRGTYRFPSQATPTDVAFKIFRGGQGLDTTTKTQILRELRVGAQLRHGNLIRLFGVVDLVEHGPVLVMEIATGGSLREVLSDLASIPDLQWSLRKAWMVAIATGMAELHSLMPNSIVHRDLKAANVLLSSKDLSVAVVKIADFGLSRVMQTVRSTLSKGGSTGTLAWKAPETFAGAYAEASDMFSFGVVCFELMSRQLPWHGLSEPEIMAKSSAAFKFDQSLLDDFGATEDHQRTRWKRQNPLKDRRPDLLLAEPGCPPGLPDLVNAFWADEVADRPSFVECIAQLQTLELGKPLSFADSIFKRQYASLEAPEFADQLLAAVRNLITTYCEVHALPKQKGAEFFQALQAEAFRHPGELLAEVPFAAQRMWTSALKLDGVPDSHKVELCSMLNAVIRADTSALMPHAAVVAHGINALCVSARAPTADAGGGQALRIFPPAGVCYRGGGFDNAHQGFFDVGVKYRVPGFLATSFSEAKAGEFLYRAHVLHARPAIKWIFQLDPRGETEFAHRCKHVNLITDSRTNVPGEEEYLFAAYSAFEVTAAAWNAGTDGDPHVVNVKVATDNRTEDEALPLAPWY